MLTELIDNDVEDNKYKEAGWRVWRLENKYYEVCVRLQALPDDEALTPTLPRADAHLIYLTETEGADVAEERRARAGPLLRRGAVRLVLLDALAPTDDEESSDGGSCDEEDEESAVERAVWARWARGAVWARGAGVGAAEEEEEEHGLRRERAEQLVAAFCRALGHDLRLC
ncbi:hypothetical protein RR48_02706 [Papilio machaon]|uniref:Uncharacterized protein n=1 Tax=Papilio machaon TaxID=76193 RepID=A0A0N1IGS0_PAPMA|nr:hypothetical protein RR48_02706 [Papilio machaon]